MNDISETSVVKLDIDNIPFNIWDDYDEMNNPHTYGYIEEYDILTVDQKREILFAIFGLVSRTIFNQHMNIRCSLSQNNGGITLSNICHNDRDILVRYLQNSNFHYNNVPVHFYSES